ncbi:MAG TPA: hypothetical protein VND20_06990 [Candidatus Binataceae bacterium]|nr:hypothetical protein [Candidatus Binataceae bacterium]
MAWYIAYLAEFLNWLPHGPSGLLPPTLLGAALLCADAALVSLAIGQQSVAKKVIAPTETKDHQNLIPYREWAERWFTEKCRGKSHSPQTAPTNLDLARHEGCSFSGCFIDWRGLACSIEAGKFYNANQVTVQLPDLAKAISFFTREAFVRPDAAFGDP